MAVVAIGELVVDWIAVEKGDNPDSAGLFYRTLGGNCANVALGVGRLGTKARLIAKVGIDMHSSYLFSVLERDGIETHQIIKDARYPTAQCYCFWDRGDDYTYYNWPEPHAADMLLPEEINGAMLDDATIVHTTGISLMIEPRRASVLRAVEMAKKKNVLVSFDACFPNNRMHEMAEAGRSVMTNSDVLKVNFNELCNWHFILQKETVNPFSLADKEESLNQIKAAANRMQDEYNPALMVVTLGEFGSVLLTASRAVYCKALPVKAIAPVGAGDGYIAGLLHQLTTLLPNTTRRQIEQMDEKALTQVANFANACGALVTTTIGASDGLPTVKQVKALLAKQSRPA